MTNPKPPEKGWLVWLTGYWVTVVFPIEGFTGISLWIWFTRPKPPTPPSSPRTTSITEVLEQEEEIEERDETALLEGAETGDENLIEERDPIETAILVIEWESANALIIAKREGINASCGFDSLVSNFHGELEPRFLDIEGCVEYIIWWKAGCRMESTVIKNLPESFFGFGIRYKESY